MHKKTITVFILSLTLSSTSFAYESQKTKIDMHGGKGDALLTKQSAFGLATSIGNVLNKKGSSKEEKKEENKKFIKIENIEKIEEDIK